MIQAIDPRAIRQERSTRVASGSDFSAVLAATTPTATTTAGVIGGQNPATVSHAAVTGLAGSTGAMAGQSGYAIPGSYPYAGSGFSPGTGVGYVPPFATGGAGVGGYSAGGVAGATGVPPEIAQSIMLMRDTNMQMIAVQADVQNVNREFSTLSNILKSKHDTERIAIQNMRVA